MLFPEISYHSSKFLYCDFSISGKEAVKIQPKGLFQKLRQWSLGWFKNTTYNRDVFRHGSILLYDIEKRCQSIEKDLELYIKKHFISSLEYDEEMAQLKAKLHAQVKFWHAIDENLAMSYEQ